MLGERLRVRAGDIGRRGAAGLLRHDFAAIVLDIRMPGMSGIELAKLIKQRKRTQRRPDPVPHRAHDGRRTTSCAATARAPSTT